MSLELGCGWKKVEKYCSKFLEGLREGQNSYQCSFSLIFLISVVNKQNSISMSN